MTPLRLLPALLAASALLAGCSSPEPGPDAGVTGKDAGDGGLPSAFDLYTLDPAAKHKSPISLAVKGDKLGVSYFVDSQSADGGVAVELRYVEFAASTRTAAAPEKVAQVTNVFGEPSLAFDSKGAPHVAYLGPPSNEGTFWYDSKALVSSRSNGTWTSSVAVSVDDEVVGLYSTLAIDESDNFLVAYRDVNYGQFPVQDWQHSRLGFVTGRPGSWTDGTAVIGADRFEGHGGLMSMVLANGRPAMTYSTMPGGAADTPRDVMFILRDADGTTWPTNPTKVRAVGNTFSGPSLAWNKNALRDQSADFIIAWRNETQLFLTESMAADGSKWKAADDPVHGTGSGGWYPSAAFTAEGFPAVSYYVCSYRPGIIEPCPAAEDELLLAWRTEDVWQKVVVDPEGGHYTKLAYWDGRAVVAYRDTADKAIKLAIYK